MSLPKLTLCMICKNETHCITDVLEDVSKYIDYWVICDTGSTDGTQELVKEFFKEKNIPGELHEDEWVDFGHNRTLAFKRCENKAQYAWVIDADDSVHGEIPFEEIYSQEFDLYKMTQRGGDSVFYVPKLFNLKQTWKYTGVLHEFPECTSEKSIKDTHLEGDYYVFSGRSGDRNQNPNKYEEDALLLEKELEKNPKNTRTVFYLAQSYHDSKQYKKAIAMYARRYNMPGFPGERYYSALKIGEMFRHLYNGETDSTKRQSYEINLINAMVQAHNFLPIRAEALYVLANHFRETENYGMCYFYSKIGKDIPKPTDDNGKLFMYDSVYDYHILFEFSISAYWVGHIKEGAVACIDLIGRSKVPDNVKDMARRNLSMHYLKHL